MEFAAVLAAVILCLVAAFQAALVAGAPWGDHAYGGRAPTEAGRLGGSYRIMSGVAVPILLLAAWIVLSRAGVIGEQGGWDFVIWIVFAYLALNTLANLASSSRIERFGAGSATLVAAACTLIVALAA